MQGMYASFGQKQVEIKSTTISMREGTIVASVDLHAPSKQEVDEKLRKLIGEDISRKEAADWAVQWVIMDHPNIDDKTIWKALVRLSGADLRENEASFLHDSSDFEGWLDEFLKG
ncbi:MAG: hypothetical protein H6684_12790 [Deltaproteobacteria bacterium]|nr:hypothetical protein [Deltaproteobacteria bacterium]MCB9489601.1 hypothetical protein [Deltaproteobacteria bacterium]